MLPLVSCDDGNQHNTGRERGREWEKGKERGREGEGRKEMKKCYSLITLGALDAAVVGKKLIVKCQAFLEDRVYLKTIDSGDTVLKWRQGA